ncbi:MAG: lysophospholipid acyltransferase family protein [Planctomycetes bacterium]|nr:lysophospholipid acyltransferase family protein [Planctomycetota bacterium]MCB9912744.1 lysophospholipid acyltransferase family protein [Planctomycetota bacterium]HPF15368.1 lysophospholipid acyltransferase family protein [Planctomycetota bacterium]
MADPPIPIRRKVRAACFAGLARALACMPPEGIRRSLLPAAWMMARWGPGRIALGNLQDTYGNKRSPSDLRALRNRVFRHAARQTAETIFLAHAKPARLHAWLAARVTVDSSIDLLREALAGGRGALVVTAHLGHWELLAASLAQQGFQGSVVGRYRRRDPSAAWFVRMRAQYGVPTLPQDGPPKELLRRLADGQIVGLLCDLEVRRLAGEFVPFLGRPALTMLAPAALARASRAPLVPVRCVLQGDTGRYLLSVEPPILYRQDLAPKQARSECLAELNRIYGNWILEDPEQWAWYQPRWRTLGTAFQPIPLPERLRRQGP